MERFRRLAEEAGRDPGDYSVTLVRPEADKARLAAYAEAGYSRVLFTLPSADRDVVLRALDEYQPLIA